MKKIVLVLLVSIFFLQSCNIGNRDIVIENNVPVINTVGEIITKEYDIYYETEPDSINYSNPKENKYIGAYIENAVYKGDIDAFEDEMGEHSMYVFDFNLNKLDTDLLKDTIISCIINGAVPYIILTSDTALYDMKIEDIEEVMEVLKWYDYPMVLEILPYQEAHNYNEDLYKLFYIQAYDIVKTENEMVDIAFPLSIRDYDSGEKYMPDEEYFDYIAIRLDVDTKMTKEKMLYLLDEVYQSYYNKPKVVNVAISHYDPEDNRYYSDEAFDKFTTIYTKMLDGYENVVSINYMDYTYDPTMAYPYNQRYTLGGVIEIANEYKVFVKQNEFLRAVTYVYDNKCITEYNEKAIKLEDEIYLPNSIQDVFGTKIKTRKINSSDYVELNKFKEIINNRNYYLILDEENGTIKIALNKAI